MTTENLSFFTDRNYNCGKYREFDGARLYNIVGPDLAEKGKTLLIIAEIFSEMECQFYYSPYERKLPCAIYIPKLKIVAASSYNKYSADSFKSRTYDISRIIGEKSSAVEAIAGYTMNQSISYMQKSLDMLGIADILLKEYIKNGRELVNADKITAYARRRIAAALEKREGKGRIIRRSISAITCGGYHFADIPNDTRIIRLFDRYIAASSIFAESAASAANKLGYDAVISRAADSENAPLHLYIPQGKLLFVSETPVLPEHFTDSRRISMERFYNRDLLASREHDKEFFGEYIKRLYNESALYARICMDIKSQGRKLLMPFVSEKSASGIAAEIVNDILGECSR